MNRLHTVVVDAGIDDDVGSVRLYNLRGEFGRDMGSYWSQSAYNFLPDNQLTVQLGTVGIRHLGWVTHARDGEERPDNETAFLLRYAAFPYEIAGGNNLGNLSTYIARERQTPEPRYRDLVLGFAVQQYVLYTRSERDGSVSDNKVIFDGNAARFGKLRMSFEYVPPEDSAALIGLAYAALARRQGKL